MKFYYVYVDWTKEENPRPFYVGKGKYNRVRIKQRNKRHGYTMKKYGLDRRVVFKTLDEAKAFEEERRLIELYNTFNQSTTWNGFGCNYTRGGEGVSGRTYTMGEEQKNKIREKLLGNKNSAGYCRSPDARKRISDKLKGHTFSQETKKKISNTLTGRKLPRAQVLKSAESNRGRGKPVEIVKDGTVIARYNSARIASDETGVGRPHICGYCKEKRKQPKGLIWRYAQT